MIDRNKLLPRSGLGVIDQWLVIARLDAPLIRVDLRLLDRVEIQPTDEETVHDPGGKGRGSEVLLVCGDLTISLFVADGHDAAELIVAAAAPLIGNRHHGGDLDHAPSDILLVDGDLVRLRGDFIQVGNVAFRVDEVREYAEAGANLPLPGGRVLQAAMAMLVVAAAERARNSQSH
jgi:hypothetical protein